jgi:NitT/TauT family transport system substrate-binding protein
VLARIRDRMAASAVLVAVLAAWEAAVAIWSVPTYVLPAPSAIAVKLVQEWQRLAGALATTLGEALAGYVLGNAVGFALAVLFFYRPAWDRLAMLPLVASNSVPAVAFAPVVILWFGVGMTSKIVLVAFITCFLCLQNQLQGFRQCDPQAVNVLRSFGAGERRIFWMLRLPSSLPYLFTALRVGSIRSVIIAIVAEMLGAYRGVGWVIFETTASMDYLRLWAAVTGASLAGVLFFLLVSSVEHRALWWHVSVSGGRRWRRRQTREGAMTTRLGLKLFGLAAAIVVGGLLLGASAADADDKVSIRLKWLHQAQFAGYYVARDKGFYKDEKLDVTINPGGPQIVAENLVASGADDFAHGGGLETAMTGREKGLPIVIIASLFQKTPFMLVAKPESGITKLEDFPGKKVSMWYTGMQYIVRGMLRARGIDPARITEVPQPVTMAPFIRGEVDVASVTPYNELQSLYAAGHKNLVLFDPADYGIVIPRDPIVTSEKMIKERPEVVQRFLRATLRGWKYAVENQEETIDIVMKQNASLKRDHQEAMLREVTKLLIWGPGKTKGIGYTDPKAVAFTSAFLLENKQLARPAVPDQVVDGRFWDEVPASAKVVR